MTTRSFTAILLITLFILSLALSSPSIENINTVFAAPELIYEVDSNSLDPDMNPGDGICLTSGNQCTLTAAIQEANALVGADTITFISTVEEILLQQSLPPLADHETTIDGAGTVKLRCNVATQAIVVSSDHNRIQGLYIEDCQTAILVIDGFDNIIGVEGDIIGPAQANYLEDNQIGINIISGENNRISGNVISHSVVTGISIEAGSSHNIIGVDDTMMFRDSMRNVVVNNPVGIWIGGNNNLVAGNNVYSNDDGVFINGVGNRVGVDGDGINDIEEINWVHNNLKTGIIFSMASSDNILGGNYIGTGEGGLGRAGNQIGVRLGGSLNTVGLNNDGISEDFERNIISGNFEGMHVDCWDCTIFGNYFGVDVTGSGDVGNSQFGITISGMNNFIGGEETWQANRVIGNQGNGISVQDGATGNRILGNVIYDNGNLGIDLVPIAQVNPNDDGDFDGGANNGQNYPVLSTATTDGSSVHVMGSFNSDTSQNYRLEYYANESCSASGYGEGQAFIDYQVIKTDMSGNHSIERTLLGSFPVDTAISAIAIDLITGDTSEFSACVLVTPEPVIGAMLVNSIADQVDLDPLDAVCDTGDLVGDDPECTLRAAIQQANASPGLDNIEIPGGTYVTSIPGILENEAATGDLDINDDLLIMGSGANVTYVDGGYIDRVFDIGPLDSTIQVTLKHMTIQHGGDSSVLTGQGVANRANLEIYASAIRENGGDFGSIYNFPTSSLSLVSSSVYDNTTTGNGAGIYAQNSVYIRDSTISGNTSDNNGGGIYVNNGSLVIYNSTITDNTADADDNDAGQGGGVYNNGATVYLDNSLVVNNRDMSDGGARNGTEAFDCYGAYISGGYNTVTDIAEDEGADPLCSGFESTGDLTSGFWVLGRYIIYNVQLDPLALNGGTTPTHKPLLDNDLFVIDTGNPADPGEPAACQNIDQRGIPRPYDGDGDGTARCDRGAYEASISLLSIRDAVVTEGSNARFTVELYPVSPITVTVDYVTNPGTAQAGIDFTDTSGTLTFLPGVSAQAFQVPTLQDNLDEDDETFFVTLLNPTSAVLGRQEGIGTINDNDDLPTLNVSDTSITEGNSGISQATFTVSLAAASGRQVQVQYQTQNGTAGSQDYISTAGVIIFAPGEISQTVTVSILGDTVDEMNETFLVILSEPRNASLGDYEGVCTIIDDDRAPSDLIIFLPLIKK